MPSIAQVPLAAPNDRKRRRDDMGGVSAQQTKFLKFSPHFQRHDHTTPVPIFNVELMNDPNARHIHPKPKRIHTSKRQRIETSEDQHPNTREPLNTTPGNAPDRHSQEVASPTETHKEPRSKINLDPCHICRRKPTITSELDSFMDCEGCGRRSCMVCIRECLGPTISPGCLGKGRYDVEGDYDVLAVSFEEDGEEGRTRNERGRTDSGYGSHDDGVGGRPWEKGRIRGHRRVVCSRCCVEEGVDGEVWCFGCVGS